MKLDPFKPVVSVCVRGLERVYFSVNFMKNDSIVYIDCVSCFFIYLFLSWLSQKVPPILLDKQFSDFTPDITPIILAAHTNNYEIIKLLVQRGVSIPQPHAVRCNCVECVSSSDVDSLRHSRSRLNIYKALASPSLIALSSEDPFLTAFQLSWELGELSTVENEFKSEYEELSHTCKQFAKDLLDQTRSSKELEIILNYRDDIDPLLDDSTNDLARLKLAIKYCQKEVSSLLIMISVY